MRLRLNKHLQLCIFEKGWTLRAFFSIMEKGGVFVGFKYDRYQTMRLSFEQICQGKSPWIPLGNFMNHWYGCHFDERERLIIDPLPERYPQEYHEWAAFCAASVRWFCSTYEIPCPSWVDDPRYVLSEPWCMSHPRPDWEKLRKETAEEFLQHNIYCGCRVYKNKYEEDEQGNWLRFHPVDVQERRAVARIATARLARHWAEEDRLLQEYLPTALALRAAYKERQQAMQQ